MATQFQEQGGASTMDPSRIARWAASAFMRNLAKESRLVAQRSRVERARRRAGAPHRVEYFHQVEDGYSHLAAQLLRPLLDAYDIELTCHLAATPQDNNVPLPEMLLELSRQDSGKIAPHYGLQFPQPAARPDASLKDLAARILAGLDNAAFPAVAPEVGAALWAGSASRMAALAERHPPATADAVAAATAAGTSRRAALGHYSGAMFHYGKEWYWGVDRLHHLETRLRDLGAAKTEADLIAPRPAIETGPLRDDGSLTLEIYPSMRSPYTSIIFDAAVDLAGKTGVTMAMRPVLPMVMRGVPATRAKGFYIFQDTAREARALGLNWGNFRDPIGNPVRRCHSLYPWARDQGRGTELLSAFVRAAFFDGVNTNSRRGMRRVVEAAGLSWQAARQIIGNRSWEEEIEANRLAMYGAGLWGVPSFRLLDADGAMLLGAWGQDRLWLVGREIQRHLAERRAAAPR